jgi:hypothetical protein
MPPLWGTGKQKGFRGNSVIERLEKILCQYFPKPTKLPLNPNLSVQFLNAKITPHKNKLRKQ